MSNRNNPKYVKHTQPKAVIAVLAQQSRVRGPHVDPVEEMKHEYVSAIERVNRIADRVEDAFAFLSFAH
jgi:hypothetical protein